MFKFIALPLLFAAVNAGYLGAPAIAPLAYHAPVVAAPVAVKAALPVATSYQNTYKISAPVAYAAAPVVKAAPVVAAPVAYASPVVKSFVAPAPLAYAAGPVLKAGPVFASAPLAYGIH